MSSKLFVALLNSHIDGDEEQFLSIALQVAAQDAREGRQEEADKLKRLVQKARDRKRQSAAFSGQTPTPLARPKGELQGVVTSSYPSTRIDDMVLDQELRSRLVRVVRQQQKRTELRSHGQTPVTHMLLAGPPGTGKTMTAAALAGELRLPLFAVQLEALFSRFLGETAAKLRLLFDQISQMRGVYLLDEFDAIGSRRADTNDVGEIRRVLNSVLSFMEEPNSTDSVVLCATNHVEILDSALARRFDEVVEYRLPDRHGARVIIERRLGKYKIASKSWAKIGDAIEGLSQAELGLAADAVVKDAILDGRTKITLDDMRAALQSRQLLKRKFHKHDS